MSIVRLFYWRGDCGIFKCIVTTGADEVPNSMGAEGAPNVKIGGNDDRECIDHAYPGGIAMLGCGSYLPALPGVEDDKRQPTLELTAQQAVSRPLA
jgi:hypothetical protein